MNTSDVLVWGTDDADGAKERDKNALYRNLDAVREGRSIDTGPELAGAIYFTTVLSLPLVVEQLVPRLATALAYPRLEPSALEQRAAGTTGGCVLWSTRRWAAHCESSMWPARDARPTAS